MTLSGALSYGESAGRFPQAGGGYVYLKEAFGRRTAFLYGWMCLLVMDPGLTASLATGSAAYAALYFPLESGDDEACCHCRNLGAVPGEHPEHPPECGLHALDHVAETGRARADHIVGDFVPLGFVVEFHSVPGAAARFHAFGAALAVAMVGAFYSFGGWWEVTKIAGEVRDPGRTMQRALVLGVVLVTTIYVLISGIFLYLLPLQNVTSDETFVAQVGAVLFGPAGGIVFAAIVVVCVFGSLAGFTMSAPRVYYAMAKDGLFCRQWRGLISNSVRLQRQLRFRVQSGRYWFG